MTAAGSAVTTRHSLVPLLIAAVLANGTAGLLYVWSLFILPIETALALDRADLGLVSSLTLISFTAGVSVMPSILSRIGRLPTAVLAFALMGGGHLVFGFWQGKGALLAGYGLGFGAGSGLAYGFALSLAASLPDRLRAVAIGLAMGAFALSGIVLPFFLGDWIAATEPAIAFLRIGAFAVGVGFLCVMALLAAGAARVSMSTSAAATAPQPLDRPFLLLSAIFFLVCFSGLAVVSQAAAMAADAGIAPAGYAAAALTIGYVVGSLAGAPLAERMGEGRILLGLGALALAGAVAILTGSKTVLFLGVALIGITFGGSGSIMPVLLGLRYGAGNITRLYGKMIVAYGLAGLIAPAVAGLLYNSARSYAPTLSLCIAASLLVIVVALRLGRVAESE